jgi:UTP--glucose-1-phosphate uridylyltransferase
VVDEARAAGIEHFIFVTGRNKGVIEDHFDKQIELERALTARGKTAELGALGADQLGPGATSFTRQQVPLGLGHAVWCARDLVGREPFALLLPDVLVKANGKGCLAQMLDVYAKHGGNIVAVEAVPYDKVENYGVVSVKEGSGNVFPINGMVEKPRPGTEPSNLSILGRYILQPEIFDVLSVQEHGKGGEIQLTDAMLKLLERQKFHALKHEGRSFDCGSKLGFQLANIAYALDRPELSEALTEELKKLVK